MPMRAARCKVKFFSLTVWKCCPSVFPGTTCQDAGYFDVCCATGENTPQMLHTIHLHALHSWCADRKEVQNSTETFAMRKGDGASCTPAACLLNLQTSGMP